MKNRVVMLVMAGVLILGGCRTQEGAEPFTNIIESVAQESASQESESVEAERRVEESSEEVLTETPGELFAYVEEENGTLKITGMRDDTLTKIWIPKEIEGKTVSTIGRSAFADKKLLTDVKIAEGIMHIEEEAFESCVQLENIEIPDSIVSIDMEAFHETKWLENQKKENPEVVVSGILIATENVSGEIKIPDGIEGVGGGLYQNCFELSMVEFPESLSYIGQRAFMGCSNLTEVAIPEGITEIERYTFSLCRKLSKVKLPISLQYIGEGAFGSCGSLTEIVIPEGVVSIGNSAFSFCENLEKIEIPASVVEFEGNAFDKTKWLETRKREDVCVVVNQQLLDVADDATEIKIPEGVTIITELAFANKSNLCSVQIPSGVVRIGGNAFLDCTGLREIIIPEGVTSIEGMAFNGCKDMRIEIPSSVTDISTVTFMMGKNLTVVVDEGSKAAKCASACHQTVEYR